MKSLKTLITIVVFLLINLSAKTQTYSGFKVVDPTSQMSLFIKVDPTEDTVQIKMTGPDSVYYSIGFGGNTMSNLYSLIVETSGNIDERKLGNHTAGTLLISSMKDSSYTTSGGVATAIVKRNLAGLTADHYTFINGTVTIPIVWCYGVAGNLSYPHPGRGATTIKLTEDCIPTDSSWSDTTCDSYTSPSGNFIWTSSGIYSDTILNADGCDSVITINLTVDSSTTDTIYPVACNSYISPSGNHTWISSGLYMDTLINSAGCDSFIAIDLTINYSTSSTISPSACDSYTSPSGKYVWTMSGTFFDTIPNSYGCDSFITIQLDVNYQSNDTIYVTTCDSYTSPSGNYSWTISGTYTDTILNSAGCDSSILIFLTINTSSYDTIDATTCDSYTSPSGNHSWTQSGTYSDTIQNAASCDSIITINLTRYIVDTSLSVSASTLTANASGAEYQWLDCDNGYSVIDGDTAQTFTAGTTGNYAVEVSQDGCIDTSSCFSLIAVGIEDNDLGSSLTFYPNPSSGQLNIYLEVYSPEVLITVRNVNGELIQTELHRSVKAVTLDIKGSAGVYIVEISANGEKAKLKVIKN